MSTEEDVEMENLGLFMQSGLNYVCQLQQQWRKIREK